LTARRGEIQGQEVHDVVNVVKALVPLANMLGYHDALREMSQRASVTMLFDHYEPVPPGDDPPFRPAVGMRA
jgi:elongation factor G